MDKEVALGNVMVDCDDELRFRDFYGDLLGWEKCTLFGRPRVPAGMAFLFMQEPDYVPRVWQEALGAVRAAAQFGGADFMTMLDPAGHPFCLRWA